MRIILALKHARGCQRSICLSVQDPDPIKNYEFYLQKQRLDFEKEGNVTSAVPHFSEDPKDDPNYHSERAYCFKYRRLLTHTSRQAAWLAKAILYDDATPHKILKHCNEVDECLSTSRQSLKERIISVIREAYCYDTKEYERFWSTPAFKPYWRRKFLKPVPFPPVRRLSYNILTGLNRLIDVASNEFPSMCNRIYLDKPLIHSLCRRTNHLFSVQNRTGLLVLDKDPLPPVSNENSENLELHNFYPISPLMDLYHSHIYRASSSFGSNSLMYPHTIFLQADSAKVGVSISTAILFAFSLCYSRAVSRYGSEPIAALPEPIVCQSIACNGRDLTFVTFQLNTTAMNSNDGVKNFVWLKADQRLYKEAKREFDGEVFEYDHEVGRLFFSHVLNGLINTDA